MKEDGPRHFAHSANQLGQRHLLEEHLLGVAELARGFAAAFGAGELAWWLGLWHDLGKFSPEFQRYLLESETEPTARPRGPDHKAAGASIAARHLGLLTLLIQGHHGGLRAPVDSREWLDRLEADAALTEALKRARRAIPALEPTSPVALPTRILGDPSAAELWLRLVFSALVDADFLDTERHFDEGEAVWRGSDITMAELWRRFERDQRQFSGQAHDTVGQCRQEVYQACLDAAESPPGLFRLAVPTGGGKTRSVMAFALRHALRHGQQRIVVAVPFISITEQTAEVYREIFGKDSHGRPAVLEHHSGVPGAESESDAPAPADVWARLAAENWDAPIVVTTTVQLFESLFANTTSRTRKLHRLARSIIVLDEAQALPPHLLTSILDALRQLCEHYGTTVVLSTATQPAFEAIPVFADVPAREIVPQARRLFETLRRVNYEWRTEPALTWVDVAEIMRGEAQALAVVNTKKDALSLLDALDDPEALHLSTLLCGAHRRQVIAEVKRRLQAGEPCRLVSTQVVEAGVDLDFPLVLRALGPLDEIIQAAGRCNREGRMEKGRVIVFQPEEGGTPRGVYLTATGITGALLGKGDLDPDRPAQATEYFRQLFSTIDTDREGVQNLRAGLDYPEVARKFRMIDQATESIAVTRYGSDEEKRTVRELLDRLRRGAPDARLLLRRLQPYLVSIRTREAERYRRAGLIAPVLPDGALGEWCGTYDPVRGLTGEGINPDTLVV